MAGRRKTSKASKPSVDIFAPTRRTAAARKPGRPPVHDEAWTKVTVVLFNRQIVFLDRLAANIRAQSGAAIAQHLPVGHHLLHRRQGTAQQDGGGHHHAG